MGTREHQLALKLSEPTESENKHIYEYRELVESEVNGMDVGVAEPYDYIDWSHPHYKEFDVTSKQYSGKRYFEKIFLTLFGYYTFEWPPEWIAEIRASLFVQKKNGKYFKSFTWEEAWIVVKHMKLFNNDLQIFYNIPSILGISFRWSTKVQTIAAQISAFKPNINSINKTFCILKAVEICYGIEETRWVPCKLTEKSIKKFNSFWPQIKLLIH